MEALENIEARNENKISDNFFLKPSIERSYKLKWTKFKNALNIYKIIYTKTGSVWQSFQVFKKLLGLHKKVWGKLPEKWVSAGKKKYFMLYAPGFPSNQLNRMYEMEVNKLLQFNNPHELRFAFFAITKKCPLSCEHCFEWDKLHSKELLSLKDLRFAVLKLKEMNIVQLHLSGGEPMLRVNDIVKLAEEFSNDMEFYVLTSGFNATRGNVKLLKDAGVTGLVVSIDHYDKNIHNSFRGSSKSFDDAVNAVRYAREFDMFVTVSVCVSRALASFNELYNYACFVKNLGASFIQLLEPKNVGRYANKNVKLSDEQIELLCDFYYRMNFESAFSKFPIVVYHGYYQKQIGCFSAGNRSVYIDTNGDVLLCPFCHHKSGNLLTENIENIVPMMRQTGCPSYGISKI
ncbi:MAG TPA: radical SAM protein [Bacteroidia bacterium]|nr:radical SAM protein [Bacteroidia bacterium]HNU33134.1 radical SAM protein [Bacteroidia bacterium]